MAVNMVRMGLLTVDQIAQATGLSEDEVRKLSEDEGLSTGQKGSE